MRALLLAFALLAPLTTAEHIPPALRCPDDGLHEVTAGVPEATFYVDVREGGDDGIFLYEETNGIWFPKDAGVYHGDVADDDLQRGGASPYIPDDPETCIDEDGALVPTDLLIY